MTKRMILAALALTISLPAAMTTLAQDDDIYFKKPTKKTIYQETENETWSTDANDDWDLDSYNRRGTELDEVVEEDLADAAFYYEIPDGNGGTRKVASLNDSLKVNTGAKDYTKDIAPIHDTIFVVEQYAYCDRIRRFYNPYFGYYRYSPWYDIAYYDPFFWDYCYYDPWWYVTPSFGFHYGSWYWGWDYGYYTGWYGGWYCPYYHPYPHYYYPSYGYGGGSSSSGGTIRRSNGRRDGFYGSRNSSGSHVASRGGWRGDGGTRGNASGSNRSYRMSRNVAGTTAGTLASGSDRTMRRRSTENARLTNSNMRINPDQQTAYRIKSDGIQDSGNRGNGRTINRTTQTTSTANRAINNSTNRRADVGVRQNDRGEGIRVNRGTTAVRTDNGSYTGGSRSTYSGAGSSSSRSTYSGSSSSSSSRSTYSSGSSSSSSRSSSSSPSRSSSSSSSSSSRSSGSYSSGGGFSGGGSSSGGGRSGRR